MAKSNKPFVSFSELYKQAFGKLAKRQLIMLAGALGLLVVLVGAIILLAKPKQQNTASQTSGNAPTEQTQAPQQPAPADEAKPSEEKPPEPEKKAPVSTPSANSAPEPQNQVAPTRDKLKVETKFDVLGVSFGMAGISCAQRMEPPYTHINYYSTTMMHRPSPGGNVQYRWEIMGNTSRLEGQIPSFGVTQTAYYNPDKGAFLGNFTATGPVYEPFSFRLHILSPRDVATEWVRVPASTETCR